MENADVRVQWKARSENAQPIRTHGKSGALQKKKNHIIFQHYDYPTAMGI